MTDKIVVGICSACHTMSKFTWVGTQRFRRRSSIVLYTCRNCGSTISYASIKQNNNDGEEVN